MGRKGCFYGFEDYYRDDDIQELDHEIEKTRKQVELEKLKQELKKTKNGENISLADNLGNTIPMQDTKPASRERVKIECSNPDCDFSPWAWKLQCPECGKKWRSKDDPNCPKCGFRVSSIDCFKCKTEIRF